MRTTIKNITTQLLQLENNQNLLTELHRETHKLKKEKVCAFCPYPNFNFRDEVSKKEYEISALCQNCQDEMFPKGGK